MGKCAVSRCKWSYAMTRKMASRLLLCAILLSISSITNGFNIYGQWQVTKILDAAEIASLPENEAKKLIGTTVSILQDRLLFAGAECMQPSYASSHKDSTTILREEWHVSAVRMQLPDVDLSHLPMVKGAWFERQARRNSASTINASAW